MGKSQTLKTVLIITVNTIVLILVSEAIARFALWTPINPYDAIFDELEERTGEAYTFREPYLGDVSLRVYAGGLGDLVPDQNGTINSYPHRPYHVVTNSVGLRNTEELDTSDESYRILAIGDSFTYGLFVANEDSFPAQIETQLRHQNPGLPVQVLNAGVPGYTSKDQYEYLLDKGLALEPDLVVLGVMANDISDMLREESFRQANISYEIPDFGRTRADGDMPEVQASLTLKDRARRFLENFALFNVVRIVRFQFDTAQLDPRGNEAVQAEAEGGLDAWGITDDVTFINPDSETNQVLWDEYESYLRDMLQVLEDNDIPVILVAFPFHYQVPEDSYPDTPQQFLASIVSDFDITYVDLIPAYRQAGTIDQLYLLAYDPSLPLDEAEPYFPERARYKGNFHPATFGYMVAAEAVMPHIDLEE